MSPSGPRYAGTAVDSGGGVSVWVNPGNATGAPDGAYATNTASGNTDILTLTNFGFTIPSVAVVDGVYVEIDGFSDSTTTTTTLQLLKNGAVTGTAKNSSTNWPSSLAFFGFGSSTDNWGATLKGSDVNSSNFGFQLQANLFAKSPSASIDAVRITIYWHIPPALVNYRALYQVFDKNNNYLGLLPGVISQFTYSQDINTSGTQTTITCAVNSDTAPIPVTTIDDQSGNPITDESGNDLYTERQPDVEGDSNSSILFKNGNKIKIYEIGYWYPNGKLRFSGEINRIEANIGSGNDQIKLVIYSDGADMNNQVITGGGIVDQSQTVENSNFSIYYNQSGAPVAQLAGQTFMVGSGITTLEAISVMLSTNGQTDSITLQVYSGVGGTLLASTGQIVNAVNPTVFNFILTPILNVTSGQTLFFSVQSSLTPGNTVIYYDSSTAYTNGVMYEGNIPGSGTLNSPPGWTAVTGSLYFQTFYDGNVTTVSYSSVDPSNMLLDIVDRYNGAGGLVQANSSNVALTGLSTTYTFVVGSVLEGVQEALALAPPDWYWTVNLATDELYFNSASAAPTHTLIKGQHIANLNMILTIENIVNTLYFTGGIAGTGAPSAGATNVYGIYQNAASLLAFGQRLDRQSDNRVTAQATANLIGNSAVTNQAPEQYQTQVDIAYPNYDTTLFQPGDICNFAGFGNYIDKLSLQIVRVEYKPSAVTLTLGLMQPRQQIQVQQILDGLVAQQTVYNPSTPA